MNTDLQQFVREALARGMAREQVRTTLLAARWRAEEIDAALAAWADGEAGLPVPRRHMSLSAREAFLHLVLFATLYIFAFDVGALLFVLIEMRWFDPAAMNDGRGALETLRWSTSGVVTALPIFLWTHFVVERALVREPEKRSSGVRRWLTYLTLFVAALVLIANFTGLVSNALAGELSARVVLKALVVFAIAGVVFGHYLGGLRREEADADARPRRASWLGRLGIAAAALAAVAGLFHAGSPHSARGRQLDTRRLDDLEQLESEVRLYYSTRHVLPARLTDVPARDYAELGRRDPITGRAYAYARVDSLVFRLGATFATADTLRADGRPIDPEWRHAAGPATFRFEVGRGDYGR